MFTVSSDISSSIHARHQGDLRHPSDSGHPRHPRHASHSRHQGDLRHPSDSLKHRAVFLPSAAHDRLYHDGQR